MLSKKAISFASLLFPLCCFATTPDQIITYPKKTDLFETTSQQSVYRIPAIITCQDGSILAFSDRRSSIQDVRSDQQIDIVCRRSKDGGLTWSEESLVMGLAKKNSEQSNTLAFSINQNAYSDPVVVADKASNKIIVLCAHGYGIGESKPGTSEVLQIVRVESEDGGLTWKQPENITESFYGVNYTGGQTVDGENPKEWKAVFAPSGKLLQLRDGRLAISMYVHTGKRTCNYAYISSDLGKTWKILGNCAANDGDEAKLEELADGKLMISSRVSYQQRIGRLYNYYSFDTNRWGETQVRTDVETVNNNAEIKVLTSTALGHATDRMLFSFANTLEHRNRQNLCVYYSYEEGNPDSWQFGKTLCKGTGDYSTMTILPDRTIGALTERRVDGSGWDFHIDYDRFSIEELTNGRDWINVNITDNFNPLTDENCMLKGVDGSLTIQANAMADLIGDRTAPIPVFDTISVKREFETNKFYIISFPFDIKHMYVDGKELKAYDLYALNERSLSANPKKIARKHLSSTLLPKSNTAYLFRLPAQEESVEVTFVTAPKQQLSAENHLPSATMGAKTKLQASSDLLKPQVLQDVYVLNKEGNAFEWMKEAEITNFTGYLKAPQTKNGRIEIEIR
ncbi:MAG: sialidase family protein [Bacteroidales bacterium]